MFECPGCGATEQTTVVCLNCGRCICEQDVLNLKGRVDELRDKYARCYKVLMNAHPSHSIEETTQLIKHLPSPNTATSVDIICIADSISRGSLELLYPEKLEDQTEIGDFVRQEILFLDDINYDCLSRLSGLHPLLFKSF